MPLQSEMDSTLERGLAYLDGDGVPTNLEKAIGEFSSIASINAIAAYYLGYIYSGGNNWSDLNINFSVDEKFLTFIDYNKAATWYKKSAELGDEEAQYRYALCCLNGKGVAQNEEEAAFWAQGAAEQQFAEGQILLASLYLTGKGVKKSPSRAITILERVARQPEIEPRTKACLMLAEIFFETAEQDRLYGLPSQIQHYLLTHKWATEAATTDIIDCKANYYLGTLYYHGYGVTRDFALADQYIENAVQNGEPGGYFLKAKVASSHGDSTNAKILFEKSVTMQSYPEYWKACIALGALYLSEKKPHQALLYFQKACTSKLGLAEHLISKEFSRIGAVEAALSWALLSACKGFVDAGDDIVSAMQEQEMTMTEWRLTQEFADEFASNRVSETIEKFVSEWQRQHFQTYLDDTQT